MNTRLLKINAMKRFCRFLDQTDVHPSTIDYWASPFCRGKEWENIEERLDSNQRRWNFCIAREKRGNKRWKSAYLRSKQFELAELFLKYISKRNQKKKARKNNGHKQVDICSNKEA